MALWRSAWSVTCTERPSGLSSEHVGSWFSEPVWLTGSVGVSTLPHRTVSAVAVSAVALRTGIATFSQKLRQLRSTARLKCLALRCGR